jgi:membrane-bound metal-dependent hydrolase YbcI (DUF457 family)
MFLGHFGAGFAGKAAAPRVSLGTLFLAAQFLDLLWPTLLLVGLERVEIAPGATRVTPLDFVHYPISHSLLAVVLWAIAVGGLFWLVRRSARGALVVGALVVSHWLLDLVVHRPDLPLVPGGSRLGLGLWHSLPATLVVELALFGAGLALYLRRTRARDRAGSLGLWSLVAFLLLIYAANLLGPPPPSVGAIAWVGQAQWLLVAWAYWLDRHRVDRAAARQRIEEVRAQLSGRTMSDSAELIRELRGD